MLLPKQEKPKDFVNELVPKFKEAWNKIEIDYDRFIRTTDKDHEKVVCEILQKVYDKGDIYKGKYEGLYCTGCEAYYTEKIWKKDFVQHIKRRQNLLLKRVIFQAFKISR